LRVQNHGCHPQTKKLALERWSVSFSKGRENDGGETNSIVKTQRLPAGGLGSEYGPSIAMAGSLNLRLKLAKKAGMCCKPTTEQQTNGKKRVQGEKTLLRKIVKYKGQLGVSLAIRERYRRPHSVGTLRTFKTQGLRDTGRGTGSQGDQ